MKDKERWEGAIATKGKRRRKGGRPSVCECLWKEGKTNSAIGTMEVVHRRKGTQRRKGVWKREGAFRRKALLCNNHARTRPSATNAWQRSKNDSNYY